MKIKTFTPPTYNSEDRGVSSLKSLLLLVAMLLVATSNAFAQASFETIDGIRYLIDSDAKTATVVASSGDKYSGDVVVPEKVKASDETEYPVTALGDEAFQKCFKMTSISIPSSVTSIRSYCFYGCSGLTSITIPSSVTSLGNDCFGYCDGLTSITIPSSVTSVGYYCFYLCTSLTNVTIPSSVTSLGSSCFERCSSLTNVTIPSSVTKLPNNCFKDCSRLTSITIPSSVTSLEDYCFQYCSSLASITIPSSVTSLGSSCFNGCSSLTSITIPSSVLSLGVSCLNNCTKLEQLIFKGKRPKGVIDSDLPGTCIIYVPQAYLQDYKDALGNKFSYIYAAKEEGESEDQKTEQCATPTITYADGELQFASTTDGAQYHYTLTSADFKNDAYSEDGKVELAAAYNITAYATADGYKTSEKATAVLYWVKANGNLDNNPTNINQAKTRGIVATSRDGIVTLSGLDNGEEVRFYSVDGKQIGATKAIEGVASQAVSSASLVIAKIGGQAIKIAVK